MNSNSPRLPTAHHSPSASRRRLLGWMGLAVVSTPAWLAGCGGGGSDVAGGSPPDGSTPDPTPSTGMSDADRSAAFALVSAKESELRRTLDTTAYLQALAAYMATLPAYTETGYDLDSTTVWGRMADGRAHLIIDGRPVNREAASASASRALAAAQVEIPLSQKARLLHAFGEGFEGQATVDAIGGMLTSAGWSKRAGLEGDASLEALRNVAGDGFFYINTHGGPWGRVERSVVLPIIDKKLPNDSPMFYALTSSTRWGTANDADPAIADDLANWRLVYIDADMGLRDANNQTIKEKCYGITAGFVQRYWTFAPHATALINACSSARTDKLYASAFIVEMQLAGIDTYLGWTETVSATGADRAARYAVDRLVGANVFMPEAPSQRAFPSDLVLADMRAKGTDFDPGHQATLVAKLRSNEPATHVLAPTIQTVQVIETLNELHLYGGFGSERGTVFIDGTTPAIKDWQPTKIVVDLPPTGAGSIGNVLVKVRTLSSNVRTITQWVLPIAFDSTNQQDNPAQRITGSGTLRFRADVGSYRDKPGQPPIKPVIYAACTRDSTLTLTASGSRPDVLDPCTHTWSGSITYSGTPLATDPLPSAAIISYLQVDTANRKARMAFQLGVQQGVTMHDRGCRPLEFLPFLTELDGDLDIIVPGSDETVPLAVSFPALNLSLASTLSIAAGSYGPDEIGCTIRWSGANPSSLAPAERPV